MKLRNFIEKRPTAAPSYSAEREESRNAKNAPVNSRAAGSEDSHTEISQPERTEMIAQAAYLRAEKRGFESGRELDDWLEAEAEINGMFGAKRFS